jgi:type II secretory pathway pseudopilin PulG
MRRRRGFTITELLVAMALIIFIMYILADAFSAGTSAFRSLKAIGDMNERLRTTTTILRRYLSADHFDGKRRLSDPNFWQNGPPREGFIRIWHNSALVPAPAPAGTPYLSEGTDLDLNPSYRAVDHGLHFAVKLRGNNRADFFRTNVPPGSSLLLLPWTDSRFQEPISGTVGTVCSPWAEVAVFMQQSPDVTEDPSGTAASLPLYTLYLRQRLVVPDNSLVNPAIVSTDYVNNGNYVEMSCYQDLITPTNLYFNSPADLTMPGRRLGAQPPTPMGQPATYPYAHCPAFTSDWANSQSPASYPTLANEPPLTGGLLGGDDVLLTNVVSFEVRVLLAGGSDFVPLSDPTVQAYNLNKPQAGNVPQSPFNASTAPYVFDTWSSMNDDFCDYTSWATPSTPKSIPLFQNSSGGTIRIVAIQITIRIWDQNTKQTRQSSLVVDL